MAVSTFSDAFQRRNDSSGLDVFESPESAFARRGGAARLPASGWKSGEIELARRDGGALRGMSLVIGLGARFAPLLAKERT